MLFVLSAPRPMCSGRRGLRLCSSLPRWPGNNHLSLVGNLIFRCIGFLARNEAPNFANLPVPGAEVVCDPETCSSVQTGHLASGRHSSALEDFRRSNWTVVKELQL